MPRGAGTSRRLASVQRTTGSDAAASLRPVRKTDFVMSGRVDPPGRSRNQFFVNGQRGGCGWLVPCQALARGIDHEGVHAEGGGHGVEGALGEEVAS